MKTHPTVYEMIQALSKYHADDYVEFHVWASHEQVKTYDEDAKYNDYVKFVVEHVDTTDIHFNGAVVIEMDVEDL